MCLIGIAIDPAGRWPLVIAANRDEFHRRPTEPASWWGKTSLTARAQDRSGRILAGRDLLAGGTWLGLRAGGYRIGRTLRIGALTNIRPGLMADRMSKPDSAELPLPSRGALVTRWLESEAPPAPFLHDLRRTSNRYAGFNLLVFRLTLAERPADADGAHIEGGYLQNRDQAGLEQAEQEQAGQVPAATDAAVRALGPGVYVASNATLGVEWPKTRALREALTRALACAGTVDVETKTGPEAPLFERLFTALADRTEAPAQGLPATGLDRSREQRLSPIFIADPDYGTRCSTVITVERDGDVLFFERSFGPDGRVGPTIAERLRLG